MVLPDLLRLEYHGHDFRNRCVITVRQFEIRVLDLAGLVDSPDDVGGGRPVVDVVQINGEGTRGQVQLARVHVHSCDGSHIMAVEIRMLDLVHTRYAPVEPIAEEVHDEAGDVVADVAAGTIEGHDVGTVQMRSVDLVLNTVPVARLHEEEITLVGMNRKTGQLFAVVHDDRGVPGLLDVHGYHEATHPHDYVEVLRDPVVGHVTEIIVLVQHRFPMAVVQPDLVQPRVVDVRDLGPVKNRAVLRVIVETSDHRLRSYLLDVLAILMVIYRRILHLRMYVTDARYGIGHQDEVWLVLHVLLICNSWRLKFLIHVCGRDYVTMTRLL